MKNLNLLCAYNPNKNPGMYSVDYAGKKFVSDTGSRGRLFNTQGMKRIGKVKYGQIHDASDVSSFENLIYWGDFQNNPMWGHSAFVRRELRTSNCLTEKAAFDKWKELYLNIDSYVPEEAEIYSVGGCFAGLENYLERDGVHEALTGFIRRSSAVIVRDPLSYETLQTYVPDEIFSTKVLLGYDVSSLLNKFDGNYRERRGGYFVWSFGRSGIEPNQEISIVSHLEKKLGLRAIHIDWLRPKIPFNSRYFFHSAFTNMLKLIANAQFCITDIYHHTLNSMNVGTPVVLLYKENRDFSNHSTLFDDKKKALFTHIGCEDMLVHVNEGKNVSYETLDSMCSIAESFVDDISYPKKQIISHLHHTEKLRDLINSKILKR